MLAEMVINFNRLYMRTHRVPSLYDSKVVYQEEPPGQPFEEFAPIPQILLRGWGDCDDLVPWRVAELREHGEPAQPRILWQKAKGGKHKGKKIFHFVVRRARKKNGVWTITNEIECPSTILGM